MRTFFFFSTPTTRNSWEMWVCGSCHQKGAAAPGGAVTRATDLVVTWPTPRRPGPGDPHEKPTWVPTHSGSDRLKRLALRPDPTRAPHPCRGGHTPRKERTRPPKCAKHTEAKAAEARRLHTGDLRRLSPLEISRSPQKRANAPGPGPWAPSKAGRPRKAKLSGGGQSHIRRNGDI